MKTFFENLKAKLSILKRYLPYGTCESCDDLNPQLYHAVHIYWLKVYGLWYYKFSPFTLKFWLRIIYTITVLMLVCFIPGVGEVFYLLKRRENIGDIAAGLYLFLSEMYTYFKIAVFWLNKEKILSLLKYLHCKEFKPYENEHMKILRKSIKVARFVMTYYSTMCVGAVSVGIVMPLTENFNILPTNVEYPYFDVYKSPAYAIIYLHHVYYKPATCIIDGVMDTILAAFVVSASKMTYNVICFFFTPFFPTWIVIEKRVSSVPCVKQYLLPISRLESRLNVGQIEILTFNLRNFNLMAERRRQRELRGHKQTAQHKSYYVHYVLRNCIVHYNAIIRYVSMIEGAFSLASALQFMLSVMVLCLVGIQFLSIEDPKSHPMQIMWMAIYLTCMLIEVFILCWFGNELILKSLELRQAAFDGPWLEADPKTAMYIIIIMERSKRPLRVTAGKIFTLSLDTYTCIINWSYKAFAVMRNVKK